MIYYIQSYGIILIEIVCMLLFFEAFCKKTELSGYKSYGIIIGAVVVDCIICTIFISNFWLKEVFVIIFWGLISFFLYRERIWKTMFLSMAFQGLLLGMDYITVLIDVRLLAGGEGDVSVSQFLLVCLAKSILFLVVLLLNHCFAKKNLNRIKDRNWIKLMAMPAFSVCVSAGLVFDMQYHTNAESIRLYRMMTVGLLTMNVLVYFFLRDIFFQEEKLYENQLFLHQAENKLVMYEALAKQSRRQQALGHEYKNQIACLKMLSGEKDYQRLDEYLDEIHEGIRHSMDAIDTHHVIINAVLNDKYKEAVDKQIPFIVKINDLRAVWLSDNDLVVLLSNVLNNAIEASERCKEEPFIKVKLVLSKDEFIFSVVNRYEGVTGYNEDRIISSKEEAGHGYGIKNVIGIVEKYGGDYHICTDGERFSFVIIFVRSTE